jgi:transposase
MCRQAYPSDLSNEEWNLLAPLIPPAKPGGHPRTTDMRKVINAILYLDRTGAQWRALPHDFPRLFDRVELLPHLAQRWDVEAHPHSAARTSAGEAGARADAQRGHHRQSIGENQPKRGARGYDGGKRVKGRKRHVLVDTTGLIVGLLVHEANIQDHQGGKPLLSPLKDCLPRLSLIWAVSRLQEGRLRRVGQRDTRLAGGDCGASLERPARRLGPKGCRHRLGEDPAQWLPCPQMALDRGTNIRVALHLASPGQGL